MEKKFLPAGGRRGADGSVTSEGGTGHYSSSTQFDSPNGLLLRFVSGFSIPDFPSSKARAQSSRCVRWKPDLLFLPAVGYRFPDEDATVSSQLFRAFYWSSTEFNSWFGHYLTFDLDSSLPASYNSKAFGNSVRCVR